MLSRAQIKDLMEQAIDEAKKSTSEDHGVHPMVGAVLADTQGTVLVRAHRNEGGAGQHAEFSIIAKANSAGIDLSQTILFVTLEPCIARGPDKKACALRIIESGIPIVYFGMLDPNQQICGRGETWLRSKSELKVERFPADLIKQIHAINTEFIDLHKDDHLPKSSLYVSTQIGDLIRDDLIRAGFEVGQLPFDWDVTIDDLLHYCMTCFDPEVTNRLSEMVSLARGRAFDKKYADYSYETDSRGLGDHWQRDFKAILSLLRASDYQNRSVINVGIGNGLEGKELFAGVQKLTIVDVAPKSLERASKILPLATAVVAEAENLASIATSSQDVYVSLRAYQSSYFDDARALREAYRIVRQGGVVIVSIANGFLGDGGVLIPGLVIPRTTVVDRNRPFAIAERIRQRLTLLRFEDIGVRTGVDEIYVYGRRGM